jgi:hypothetical protein
MKYLILGVLCCAAALGQGRSSNRVTPVPAAEQPPVKPEERCTIEGTVTATATGEPLRKANLILRRTNPGPGGGQSMSYAAVSDASGHFTIADIDPGKYFLMVARSGFVSQQYGAKSPNQAGTTLTLDKSQKLKDINFKLIAQGVVAGRVLDEDGDPVQNVFVQVMRTQFVRGRKQLMPAQGGQTNDLGEYRIHGLPPGRYFLSATYRPAGMGMVDAVQGQQSAYAQTYYPGSPSPDTASPVEITPGAQLRGMDVRLQKTVSVRIRGRIANLPAGRRNSMVMLTPKSDAPMNFMSRNMGRTYNAQGDFIINGVVPGSYLLTAMTQDGGKVLSARMPVEVGASNIDGITLQLAPGADITGSLTVDGTGPQPDLKTMRISLSPRDGSAMMGPGATTSGISDANTFSVANVQPDRYDVRFFGLPDGCYVKSVRFGDVDATDSGLDFSNGVTPGELSIAISTAAAQVDGTVQNDKSEAAPGASIVLIPEGKRRENDTYYKMATADQNGQFTIRNIPPGEYRLFAFDMVEYGMYQDPEWLKPFESKGQKLSIKESAHESAQLKLVLTEQP